MSCHKSDQRCRPFKVQCPRMILTSPILTLLVAVSLWTGMAEP